MSFHRACLLPALIALAGCTASPSGDAGAAAGRAGVEIAFVDVLAPSILAIETEVAIAGPDEAGGLWAAVPGLSRPERGRLRNPQSGRSVVVALFRGGKPRISRAAAEALGLEERASARVEIVAVRSEVRLAGSGAGS